METGGAGVGGVVTPLRPPAKAGKCRVSATRQKPRRGLVRAALNGEGREPGRDSDGNGGVES